MIRWPEKYSQERTSVHVHNELAMSVPPESVWPWLVRADLWPTWYNNAQNVVIEGGGHELKLGTVFRWRTFGASVTSRVEEVTPPQRIGWDAKGAGLDAYHAWLILRTESGCHVITEENQNGILARLSNFLRPGNMEKYHQVWLQNLQVKAKSGPPPPAATELQRT